jgi:hypothetical protein
MSRDTELLTEINAAVAELNSADQAIATAQADVVARAKAVGVLLLEAKKLHPKTKDFEAYLKKVNGLQRSRAYDIIKMVGGRETDDEIRRAIDADRKEKRERKQRNRADKKALPKPEPEPVFRDTADVSENPDPAAERKALYAAADTARPVIGASLLDMTVRQVATLDQKTGTVQFDPAGITLEMFDAVHAAQEMLTIIGSELEDLEQLEAPLAARAKAENERWYAERKAQAEAHAAAELARLAWEPKHPQEALAKFRADALAAAKEDNDNAAEVEASMKPDEEGRIGYGNPLHDFYNQWRKEHHTIFPGHLDEEPAEIKSPRKLPSFDVPDDIDIEKARKLLDAAQDHENGEAQHKAQCALAAFLKVPAPKSPPPSSNCDYKIDPTDAGMMDRERVHCAWQNENVLYRAAERAIEDHLWRIENPEEAAENDKEQAEYAALRAKRLAKDAKNPVKTKAKALKEAQAGVFEDEYDKDDKDEGQSKADYRDQWLEDNWDEEKQAEWETEFAEQWQQDHGAPFPEHKSMS